MTMLTRAHRACLGPALVALLLVLPLQALQAADDGGDTRRCAALASQTLSVPTRIEIADYTDAGPDSPWTSPDGFYGHASMHAGFCRVSGTISPTPTSSIGFEVWLPATSEWNGRFYGTASGGSMGAIQYAALPIPVARGFAAMAHDNGHASRNTYEQSWAFDPATGELDEEKIIDFASRAQHVSTVVAKELIQEYYGRPADYAYFIGCSQGGHHGMMQAQRYPQDYDGIVAGAHGGDWIGMLASQAWAAWQVTRDGGAGALSSRMLEHVNDRVIAACDANDGVIDGQIGDPRDCSFDPGVMQCGLPDTDPAACLTPQQIDALRAIYDGPRHPDTGEQLAPGIPRGSERFWSWNDRLQPFSGSYYDFNRLIVQRDPDWTLESMDWRQDIHGARERWSPTYDAIDPDLGPFQQAGGKLILYHGWADALITPFLSVNAWEAIRAQMGEAATDDFARLFMIPGMAHCAGGPIGATRDLHDDLWLTAIQRWVEQDIAPDATRRESTVTGVGIVDGNLRSRPYCPYPQVARYSGAGSLNRATNFACVMPNERD